MKQTIKKLTPATIKKAYAKTFTQTQITVDVNGENYVVNISTVFKATAMQELINELTDKMQYLVDYKDLLSVPNLYLLLCIKYFSDINVETKSFEEDIALFTMLFDLGIAEKILKAFDPAQLERINEFMARAKSNMDEMQKNPEAVKQYANLIAEIENKIGNKGLEVVEDIVSEDTEIDGEDEEEG